MHCTELAKALVRALTNNTPANHWLVHVPHHEVCKINASSKAALLLPVLSIMDALSALITACLSIIVSSSLLTTASR